MNNIHTKPPSHKNPLIEGDSLLSVEDTIDKATDVLEYLSFIHEDDRKYYNSDNARQWITNCAVDALRYAQYRIGMIRNDQVGPNHE